MLDLIYSHHLHFNRLNLLADFCSPVEPLPTNAAVTYQAQPETDDGETFLLTADDAMAIDVIIPIMPTLNVYMPSLNATSSKTVPKRKKKSYTKMKRTVLLDLGWTIADKSHIEVLSGRVSLSENGSEFYCIDCKRTYKCKRNFDSGIRVCKSTHIYFLYPFFVLLTLKSKTLAC